jgi:hypothetical protein
MKYGCYVRKGLGGQYSPSCCNTLSNLFATGLSVVATLFHVVATPLYIVATPRYDVAT